jgi:hypothetical protein
MLYVVTHWLTARNGRSTLFFMSDMTHVRMDKKLKDRIREYIKQHEKKTHVKIGFSAALRALVEKSLDSEGVK